MDLSGILVPRQEPGHEELSIRQGLVAGLGMATAFF
jgi:hypothetical protein